VAWTAPADGSDAITAYTITPYIGAEAQPTTHVEGSPPATAVAVSGLTNGTSYTFTVSAENAIGEGPASEHSNAVTP
jgi:titin